MHRGWKRIMRKCIAGFLAGILVFGHAGPAFVFAQEETPPVEEQTQSTPTPEPTPTTDVTVNNSETTTQTDTSSEANTGGNETKTTPTPTPADDTYTLDETSTGDESATPSLTPTPQDEESEASDSALAAQNYATISATIGATANTGSNSVQTNDGSQNSNESTNLSSSTPFPTPTPVTTTVTLSTGDSVAVTLLENDVNTTSVNSEIVYHTINLYANESGTIDLSLPSELAQLLVEQSPNDETINALFTVQNNATVTNTVTVDANTGDNSVSDAETVTITTGDAVAILSLLNRINFVMVNSVVHIAIINIFGNFTGNILLPNLLTQLSTPCETCGSTTVNNQATVTTNATLLADSGNNTVTAQNGTIDSGNAVTAVQLFDFVNTLLYGSQHLALYFNNFGTWNGQFLGWASEDGALLSGPVASGATCTTCIGNILATNNATVTNTITLSATTGNNVITDARSGAIATGNAYVMANIVNFVNTTLIRSFGFFGFINIFGSWTGDVGSKSLFPDVSSQEAEIGGASVQTQSQSPSVRETGGQLAVTTSNNVGNYVLPGDTVTIFANVKNPGSGMIYDTKMIIMLIKDKTEVDTIVVPLGNIPAGKSLKFSSGLVLSPTATGGRYAVRVAAYGYTGPENTKVSSYAESYFTIYGTSAWGAQEVTQQESDPAAASNPTVMGTTTSRFTDPNILLALLALLLLIPEYLFIRLYPKRKYIQVLFAQTLQPRAFLQTIRMLLM